MTKIKICGLTRLEDAVLAAELGADFLGFIFVPSTPRYIEPERAAEIVATLRGAGHKSRAVGVFRDAQADSIRKAADVAKIDLVQLHGSESDDDLHAIGIPAIKTFHVTDTLPDTTSAPSAEWILFDTYDDRRGGGTGRRFDWSLLANHPRTQPFFLSGGLTPDNAGAAISLVRPDGVDIASGVESEPGVKDHAKMKALFERVRR